MPDTGAILGVDDNEDFLTVLSDALALLGYETRALSDPDEALGVLGAGESFDALVLDMILSEDVSGLDVARKARAEAPGLPVVFLTGDQTVAVDAETRRLGPVIAKTDGIMAIRDALRAI